MRLMRALISVTFAMAVFAGQVMAYHNVWSPWWSNTDTTAYLCCETRHVPNDGFNTTT